MKSKYWVMVTGAGGGIGEIVVEKLLHNNYKVICIDKKKPITKLKNKLDNSDSLENVEYLEIDLNTLVNNNKHKKNLAKKKIFDCLEGKKLIAIIHLAAIQKLANFSELTLEDWRYSFDINLFAPVEINKICLHNLIENNGSIVHVGSIHSNLTKPFFSLYATTKAAIKGLTKSMAVEIGSKVRVNCIEPAAISTKMLEQGFENDLYLKDRLNSYHPTGSIGNPSDVAMSILYLIDAENSFLNGCIINLDGGIRSRLHDPN